MLLRVTPNSLNYNKKMLSVVVAWPFFLFQ
jgi:hypothetical protein